MRIIATILILSGALVLVRGTGEIIQSMIVGSFDPGYLSIYLVGGIILLIGLFFGFLASKKGAKKQKKDENEKDALFAAAGSDRCARCGMSLQILEKKDIGCVEGKLYCPVCMANIRNEKKNEEKNNEA